MGRRVLIEYFVSTSYEFGLSLFRFLGIRIFNEF